MILNSRVIYDYLYAPVYLRVCSWPPVRNCIAPHLQSIAPSFRYSPSGTGFRPELTAHRLAKDGCVGGKDVLLLGVEHGSDINAIWSKYRPQSITGIDILPWAKEWAKIRGTTVPIRFAGMDAMDLAFRDCRFDLVHSQALLEHVTDISRLFRECARVLRPSGVFHADFGPLWFTFGGPHVGALQYDHLLLGWEQYLEKARQTGNGWEFWLEKSLFNRFSIDQYLAEFAKLFDLSFLFIVGSRDGKKFRQHNSTTWKLMTAKYPEADLLIRLVSMTGRKRN